MSISGQGGMQGRRITGWTILFLTLLSSGVFGLTTDPLFPYQTSSWYGDNFSSEPQILLSPPLASDNYSEPPANPLIIPDFPEPAADEESSPVFSDSAILVMFDPRSDTLPLRTHSSIGAVTIHDYRNEGMPGLHLVSVPSRITVHEAVDYYRNQPGVLFAEPDYYRFQQRNPSDPDFWRQWGLQNSGQVYRESTSAGDSGSDIGAFRAWDTLTGGDAVVAVLDTGVDYLHPDLSANIITDPAAGTAGYDAITGMMDAMDTASHGTHCAGIIGAVGDNGAGISGVNWQTRILPVRFLNSFGTGTVSDEIESILWAAANGARIISCSYGGSSYSRAEYEVMKKTDALFICAAGNKATNTDLTPLYPASLDLPHIIAVTATDSSDTLASFSSYGRTSVDIGAPGVDIFSTRHSIYRPEPRWTDPGDNLFNWTPEGNWTLDTRTYASPAASIAGFVNRSEPENSPGPAVLTLRSPFSLSGLSNPVISYQWSLTGLNYHYSIEGSVNGKTWYQLDYGAGEEIATPFIKRECKIPAKLRQGHLFIRFIADGDLCKLGLDDVTLSEGYGGLELVRWGYMEGSSMAASHVSGMAALLLNAIPDASLSQVREAILGTARPVPSLADKTATGGVADLSAALEKITGGSQYHLKLQPGWNHVSVPYRLIPGKNTAYDVFGSLPNVSGHSLYRFESEAWRTVHREEGIIPLSSYWVFTGSMASLPLMVDENQSGLYSANLTTGWNGFGTVGDEPQETKRALTPLSDLWTYVIGFNATVQMSDDPIIRGGSGRQNDSRILEPFQGYWIYMTRNGTYEKNQTGFAG